MIVGLCHAEFEILNWNLMREYITRRRNKNMRVLRDTILCDELISSESMCLHLNLCIGILRASSLRNADNVIVRLFSGSHLFFNQELRCIALNASSASSLQSGLP